MHVFNFILSKSIQHEKKIDKSIVLTRDNKYALFLQFLLKQGRQKFIEHNNKKGAENCVKKHLLVQVSNYNKKKD